MLAILMVSFTLMSLQPVKEYANNPSEFGLAADEVTFATKDGITLYGWYFKSKKVSGTTVIISHDGNGNMANSIEVASMFLDLGFNVLTYDYRGYGKSGYFNIDTNFVLYGQFTKDIDAAVDFIQKKSNVTRVYLYGKGIGAALSIGCGAARRDVMKVIADSPFNSLDEYQKDLKAVAGKDVKIPLAYDKNLVDPAIALTGKLANLSKYLLICGDLDPVHTDKNMKSLQKLDKTNIEVHTVKKANYQTTFSTDKAAYTARLKEFMN